MGMSGCCREDVAAASAVANCASKPPKAKVLLATTQSRAAVVEGKSSSSAGGGGRGTGKEKGQPGVTSIIVKCSEAFGQLQHQQRTLSLAPCHICSKVFPESKLPSAAPRATPLAAPPPPSPAAVCPACLSLSSCVLP